MIIGRALEHGLIEVKEDWEKQELASHKRKFKLTTTEKMMKLKEEIYRSEPKVLFKRTLNASLWLACTPRVSFVPSKK